MRKRVVKKGDKFNSWTVVKEVERAGCGRRKFLCKNSEGTRREVMLADLVSGKSAGIFRKNVVPKHGMTDTNIHKRWRSMKNRCLNPNASNYENYGGRGITICDRWLYSFENFYKDMGDAPKGLTLDRIDNDGDYEPSNCKWSTYKEQVNNTRLTKRTEVRYTGKWMKIAV